MNSTLACSIVAAKNCIPIAHVEAGLRSFDRTMPEEINRIVTDVLSSYLFVTEESGVKQLEREGISSEKIYLTGNTMIDTLLKLRPKAKLSNVLDRFLLHEKQYCVVTLHRPSNVDTKEGLERILELFATLSGKVSILFPIHPRTKKMLIQFGLESRAYEIENLILTEPLGYLDFLHAMDSSAFVLTDSGGIQEETTMLQIPCITMRDNTERPVTVEIGTNILAGSDTSKIFAFCERVLLGESIRGHIPPLWDGRAAERIVAVLVNNLFFN